MYLLNKHYIELNNRFTKLNDISTFNKISQINFTDIPFYNLLIEGNEPLLINNVKLVPINKNKNIMDILKQFNIN